MNRKYNLEYFSKKLEQIRDIRPDINITTDVIVGHPYETEELFQKTLETVKRFGFSKIHAFPYSKREGTKAASMQNQISEAEKKERNRKLIQLSHELEQKYAKQFFNQSLEVLIEEVGDTYSIGHTSNYLKVKMKSGNPNELCLVTVKKWENHCFVE